MIGNMLYLMASRHDIAYIVGVCARFQSYPKTSHLTNVKHILEYINGTSDYGLFYSFETNGMLVGYCDANCVGNSEDRKITSSGCFFLGNNLISWFSKKQNCASLSIIEAEYIAAGSSYTQLLWMEQMLQEYDVP